MKILTTLKTAARDLLGGLQTADIEKRDGVFVCRYLEPLNAKKWYDWAVRHGIPNPISADEMHVTVVYSLVDVKLPRDELPITQMVKQSYGEAGVFAMFGPKDDNLVYAFSNWGLYNRHREFLENGAKTNYPVYRPHLTISQDAAGFELSDDALADVPQYIILGPEVNRDLKKKEPDLENQDGAADPEEGDHTLVIVIDIAKAKAAEMVEVEKTAPTMSFMDSLALADVAAGMLTRGVAKRLAAIETMPQEIKDLAKAAPKAERVMKSIDVNISLQGAFAAEIQKATEREDSVFKADDDRHLVWSIASVSTVKGEKYIDVDDEHFSTRALEEFMIELTKSGGPAKFEHKGEVCNRIVQGLVLSDEVQKGLNQVAEQYGGSCNLGFEPLVVCTEIPPERWDEVKKGGYRDSIAGTFYYFDEEDGDA